MTPFSWRFGINTSSPNQPTTPKAAPKRKTLGWPTLSQSNPATMLATSCKRPTVVLYQPMPLARK